MEFEPVIGLEVHAQLLTKSKIFCSCSTQFGAPPNSNICPVCLGLPGALPVLNRQIVSMAVKAGLALGCKINRYSVFARKNYFYPDLPKGYQISQYEEPLAQEGRVTLPSKESSSAGKVVKDRQNTFRIIRVHLEEDAGKSIHMVRGDTYVNFNRTGVPLIEIVSQADLRSSKQACDFLMYLRRILLYLKICDGNMEEGSLRCDVNVSIRPLGSSGFGTKTEIKNVNSFRFLRKALDYEIERQIDVIRRGNKVKQETRLWNDERQRTSPMRTKEQTHDYQYFSDPDLLPVVISSEWLERLKTEIPELPEARCKRFVQQYGLNHEEAILATHTPAFADYFEATVDVYNQPKSIFNWMMGELTRYLNRNNQEITDSPVQAKHLAKLICLINKGTISGNTAKEVFEKMYATGKEPESIITEMGLQQISDEDVLESIIDRVLKSNPQKVQTYQAGKEGLLGFFVGQVMKETRGQANPQLVNQMLRTKLHLG